MVGSPADAAALTALIPATMLPLAAFLLIFVFTRGRPRLSAGISIGSLRSRWYVLSRCWG